LIIPHTPRIKQARSRRRGNSKNEVDPSSDHVLKKLGMLRITGILRTTRRMLRMKRVLSVLLKKEMTQKRSKTSNRIERRPGGTCVNPKKCIFNLLLLSDLINC
jgi:hypothetical protein